MRAELLKVRSMPTPMWCLIAVLACFVLGIVAVVFWGPGDDSGAIDVAVGLPTLIASIVFGVWMVGVEYGQNTLRRTLTADPGRIRLILAKLAVVLLTVSLVTLVLHALALPLYSLAAQGHDTTVSAGEVVDIGLADLISNLAYATVGFAFALITASMAGGVTMALVFIFVIDTVVSIVPKIENLAMGPALEKITTAARGTNTGLFGEEIASVHASDWLIVAAWLVGLLLLGSLRLIRSDVK
jgi:ABC-2 type transport system permease protein